MHGELKSGLVPRLRCADGVGRRAWARAPIARDCGAAGALASRHRLVRRDALRDGADRPGADGNADLFVSIGTSGNVYPAAGFVQTARYVGARTLEMNLEPSLGSYLFDESRTGPAGVLVPAWVEEMLNDRG